MESRKFKKLALKHGFTANYDPSGFWYFEDIETQTLVEGEDMAPATKASASAEWIERNFERMRETFTQ